MAGVAGLEPAITGSKPVALPLGYTPMLPQSAETQAPEWRRRADISINGEWFIPLAI